jgi:hypothetical protein
VASADAEIVIDIRDMQLHPEDQCLVGRSADGKTSYRLKMTPDEFCDWIERIGTPIAEGRCPRCDFEEAISLACYAGEYIRSHFKPDAPGQLSELEVAIVEAAQTWAADDAIARCLNGTHREH